MVAPVSQSPTYTPHPQPQIDPSSFIGALFQLPSAAAPPTLQQEWGEGYEHCQQLLHPTTLRGYLNKFKLTIGVYGPEIFGACVQAGWGVSGMMFGVMGTHALYRSLVHDEDFSAYTWDTFMVLTIPAVAGTLSAVLLAFSRQVTHHIPVENQTQFRGCRDLERMFRKEAHQQAAQEARPNRFIVLPNDIGLGTAATVDAALSIRGTGTVDRLMVGLSIFIGAGAGSAAIAAGATLARGAAATAARAATAFRFAAGTL